ncbi:hypothetical protein Bbelb_243240 [Branchiostoma belcheri]|nr:hypothetical protein Bbelb_243240 [Branchiostoma belcheri]
MTGTRWKGLPSNRLRPTSQPSDGPRPPDRPTNSDKPTKYDLPTNLHRTAPDRTPNPSPHLHSTLDFSLLNSPDDLISPQSSPVQHSSPHLSPIQVSPIRWKRTQFSPRQPSLRLKKPRKDVIQKIHGLMCGKEDTAVVRAEEQRLGRFPECWEESDNQGRHRGRNGGKRRRKDISNVPKKAVTGADEGDDRRPPGRETRRTIHRWVGIH